MADVRPTGYRGPFPRRGGGRRRWLRWLPGARPGPPRRLGAEGSPEPDLLRRSARVLVVRPDHLGDLLFVGPALELLRRRRPDLALHLLVGPWAREVAAGLPGAARVQTFAFPWFDRRPPGRAWAPYLRLWRGARALRGRFDAAVILRPDDHLSAWMAAMAGIPRRFGHAHPHLGPFLTHHLPGDEDRHGAARNLDLAAALIGDRAPPGGWDPGAHPLAFHVSADDRRRAADLTAGEMASIAIHPGSGAAVKRWRPEAWAEVARAVTAPGAPVLLTGGPGEADLTAELAALLPDRRPLDLAGRTGLGTLAALQAGCRLVLGPDSGPLHLAVAAGAPTVHLFGPAAAGRFGPWGPRLRHRVVASELDCAPCGHLGWDDLAAHPCIRDLAPALVVAAARDLLATEPAAAPGAVGPGPGRGL